MVRKSAGRKRPTNITSLDVWKKEVHSSPEKKGSLTILGKSQEKTA